MRVRLLGKRGTLLFGRADWRQELTNLQTIINDLIIMGGKPAVGEAFGKLG